MMFTKSAVNALRVAVLGSGVAGSTAARTLADRGIKVTVFEAGFGVGGRTSTRYVFDEQGGESILYQFDHGAQFISSPKTDVFREALDQWKDKKWVKEWVGNFGTVQVSSSSSSSAAAGSIDNHCKQSKEGKKVIVKDKETTKRKKERWVGYPAMNAICKNLLDHENIHVQTQTKADAFYEDKNESSSSSTCCWEIKHGKSKELLGSFDWLITTDRNSAADYRHDLSSAHVEKFRRDVQSNIESLKCLTAMVVFEKSLGLELDGILISCDTNGTNSSSFPSSSSLGWVACDTSKPGRNVSTGSQEECWVLQTNPEAAKNILEGLESKNNNLEEIREKAVEILLNDFMDIIPSLLLDSRKEDLTPIAMEENLLSTIKVTSAIGHRWGAAFPLITNDNNEEMQYRYSEMDSLLIENKRFIACGDYFGKFPGRIEGAYLSGLSAANQLLLVVDGF